MASNWRHVFIALPRFFNTLVFAEVLLFTMFTPLIYNLAGRANSQPQTTAENLVVAAAIFCPWWPLFDSLVQCLSPDFLTGS